MAPSLENGLTHIFSPHSVSETVQRIETILRAKNLTIFAVVDHSGEAEKVGLAMRPTQLIIFGSPKAGTPMMIASSTLAIDLPLKALVWQDAEEKVWVSYNDPIYLQRRHNISDELLKNISGIGALLEKAGE
nr:DUF302 domain-containing protein [Candidatus Acidoferrales bacterium]